MCGHIGCAGNITTKEERMIGTLLILDSLRGDDSTGVAVVPRIGETKIAKELGSPFELFGTKKFTKAMSGINRAIIGHNRFATSGGVSRATAHPFDFDTLVGAHNGTLKNKHRLEDASSFSVDSENLFHHIEKKGLRDALDVVDGAWALVWWDKLNETLNFLRNKERPFYMAPTEDLKTIFWASERWMLEVAASRNGIKLEGVHATEEDIHYSFDVSSAGVISKPKVVLQKAIEQPVVHYYNGGYHNNNFQHNATQPNNTSTTPTGKVVTFPSEEKKTLVSPQEEAGLEILLTELVPYYKDRKDVLFSIVESLVDRNGARYLKLLDLKQPHAPIRMYVQRRDPRKLMVGTQIIADLVGLCNIKQEGKFFKVTSTGAVIIPEDSPFRYNNGKGVLLSKKEWEDLYPNCDWCFDPLFAEDHGNRLTTGGYTNLGCLCGKCSQIEEAREGVTLKPVY